MKSNSGVRPGFGDRIAMLLFGLFSALIVFAFISGLSEPQKASLLARIGFAFVLLTPSLLGFSFFLRRVLSRSRAAANEQAAAESRRKRQEAFVAALQSQSQSEVVPAVVQGGSGSSLQAGELVLIWCGANELVLSNPVRQSDLKLPFASLLAIEINGPGTVTTHAGVVGGGFGLEGALKGILVASIINKMSAKTTTNTFVRIGARGSEIHLHVTARDPRQLRLDLSPAFVAMESARASASSAHSA